MFSDISIKSAGRIRSSENEPITTRVSRAPEKDRVFPRPGSNLFWPLTHKVHLKGISIADNA